MHSFGLLGSLEVVSLHCWWLLFPHLVNRLIRWSIGTLGVTSLTWCSIGSLGGQYACLVVTWLTRHSLCSLAANRLTRCYRPYTLKKINRSD